MSKIRVLIVDDHAVLRSGLRMLINAQTDMEVVGEAPATSEALAATREIQPDIVTLDLSMPGGGGLKFLEQARTEGLKARTVVLTMHDDPAYFRSAISAGALGYVVKTAADNELLTAIRAVNDGRLFVSMPGGKQDDLLHAQSGTTGSALSDREQQVLVYLAEGHTNKEIGERLDLSVKTIETYRSRIASKLQLRSRAEIVRYALDMGLLRQDGGATPEA
jgi:two-component system response regulator NreC